MQIRFVTNATMEIISGQVRIFCDPWIVGKAFDGSWHQWPPLRLTPEDFTAHTHLYISHIHSDHCDPETLRRLPNKDTPVIILKGPDGFLRKRIASCGFRNFIELGEGESVVLSDGVKVTMHEAFAANPFMDADVPNIIDSSIVVDDGAHRFLNLNDNEPDTTACERLKAVYGSFSAMTVPYCGVGAYPSCYPALSSEVKRMRSDAKAQQYLRRMLEIAAILPSEMYFPAAGQMRLGGQQSYKNDFLGVATQEAATDLLRRNGYRSTLLREGDLYDLDTHKHERHLPLPDETLTGIEEEPYWWQTAFNVPQGQWVNLVPLLEAARQNLVRKQHRYKFYAPWTLAIQLSEDPERAYVFSYENVDAPVKMVRVSELLEDKSIKFLMVTISYNYLMAILTRHCHWNNAYHGCQVEWLRRPDDYVPELQSLLSYLHL